MALRFASRPLLPSSSPKFPLRSGEWMRNGHRFLLDGPASCLASPPRSCSFDLKKVRSETDCMFYVCVCVCVCGGEGWARLCLRSARTLGRTCVKLLFFFLLLHYVYVRTILQAPAVLYRHDDVQEPPLTTYLLHVRSRSCIRKMQGVSTLLHSPVSWPSSSTQSWKHILRRTSCNAMLESRYNNNNKKWIIEQLLLFLNWINNANNNALKKPYNSALLSLVA